MKKKMFIAVMTIGVMSMLAGCGSIGNDGISDNKESKNRAKTEKEIDWSSIDTSQMTDDELIEVTPKSIRLRKRILDKDLRLKAEAKLKNNKG